MNRRELDKLTRDELIARAERLGVARPRVLTQPELIDEIVVRTSRSGSDRARSRGWLGRARDLIAGVVERGLHMPEAARVVRGSSATNAPKPPPPLPTVTLAEIYAAQGHFARAVAVLDEVIAREPEHVEALSLRERFVEQAVKAPASMPAGARSEEEDEAEIQQDQSDLREAQAATEGASGAASEPAADDVPTAAVDDAPLSQRYDLDEVVAVAVDPRTIYLYWEVRPTTLARARAERPDGHLAIRVANVAASWDGPTVETRDVPIDALFGDYFVRDAQPATHVRVSVGWLSDAHFDPFAVGMDLSMPREDVTEVVAHEVMRWSPSGQSMPFGGASSAGPRTAIERAWGLPEGAITGAAPRFSGAHLSAARPFDASAERFLAHVTQVSTGAGPYAGGGLPIGLGGASERARRPNGGASDLYASGRTSS